MNLPFYYATKNILFPLILPSPMTLSPSVCCPPGPYCPPPSLTPPANPSHNRLSLWELTRLSIQDDMVVWVFLSPSIEVNPHSATIPSLHKAGTIKVSRLCETPHCPWPGSSLKFTVSPQPVSPQSVSPQPVPPASRGASAGAAASRAVWPWLSSPGVVSPVVSDWLAGLLPAGRTRGTILRLGGGTPNTPHSGKTDWNKMFKPISGAKTVTLISFGFGKHLQSCKNAMLMEEVKSIDIWALSPILGSTTQFGLIWVKQKNRTGFSKGWQGSPEGFLEQGPILRAKIKKTNCLAVISFPACTFLENLVISQFVT